MIKEFNKLFHDKLLIPIWFILIILIAFVPILFMFNSINLDRGSYVREYSTKEELKEIIDNYEYFYNNPIDSKDKYESKKQLDLYTYLYENDIKYEEFRLTSEISVFNEKASFHMICLTSYSIIIAAILLIINVRIFNDDVSQKTFKLVYSGNKNNFIIWKNKVLSSLIVSSIIFILSLIIEVVLFLNLKGDCKYIILTGNTISSISFSAYIWLGMLIYFITFISYFLISIFVSSLYKSSIITIIIGLVLIILSFGSLFLNNLVTDFIFVFPFELLLRGHSIAFIIMALITKFIFSIGTFFLAILYLKKKVFFKNIALISQ